MPTRLEVRVLSVNLSNIQDPAVKQVIETLVEQLNSSILLSTDWDMLSSKLPPGKTTVVTHRLKVVPSDIVILNAPSDLVIANRTTTTLSVSSATGGSIRLLLGKIQKG